MRGSCLIITHAGRPRRVSPFLFPQFGEYNKLLLPSERELPTHGMMTRIYPFDFGFSDPSNALAPYAQADCPLVVGRDFLAWAATRTWQALSTTPPVAGQPGANATPALQINFVHTHNGVQRQWSNKPMTDGEFGGDGQYPMIFREPPLLAEGDTIMCTIQNMLNATIAAQVVLLGAEFDTDGDQEQAARA